MQFENFSAAHWIIALGFLLLFYGLTRLQAHKTMAALAPKDLLAELLSSLDSRKQKVKILFIFLALLFSIAALMRPQGGFYWEENRSKGLDILIAIDVSRSMLTEDVKPNRLEKAKALIREYARTLEGNRLGLIAFSGQAFLLCPLTSDSNGFNLTLENVNDDTIPQGGTSLSAAIGEALKYFRSREKGPRALWILSDGEDHGGEALSRAEKAKQEGLAIFCIGIGTSQGGLVPILQGDGQRGYVKDRQGRIVKSVLQEDLLQKIASRSGGLYVPFDRESSFKVFGEKMADLGRGTLEKKRKRQYQEWYQLPLILAFLLLVLEPFIGERKKEG
jgi:Ca-activated chloride channel family protein